MRVLFKVRGWLGLGEYKNRYACEEPLLNHICKCVCMCLKILSSDRLPYCHSIFYFLLPLPCCEHLSSILTPLCFLFFLFFRSLWFWLFLTLLCTHLSVCWRWTLFLSQHVISIIGYWISKNVFVLFHTFYSGCQFTFGYLTWNVKTWHSVLHHMISVDSVLVLV